LNCSISRLGAIWPDKSSSFFALLLVPGFDFEEEDEDENEAELKMKTKPLWRISITTTPEAEDAVAEMLGAVLGRAAVTYFNLETEVSTVTVYCEARPAADARKTMAAGLGQIRKFGLIAGPGKITIAKVRREDWAESWKRHFKPIEIRFRRDEFHESPNKMKLGTRGIRPSGKSLLVKPSWSKRRPRRNQAVVILDPGLSFGTGQHPTTAFCLGEIVRLQMERGRPAREFKTHHGADEPSAVQSFLDIGTGSGILSIAAAKLSYAPVHAFDFDPNAIQIARVNARKNSATGKIRFWRGSVSKLPLRPAQKYDLICANLISDLLIAERRRIAAQLNRGGTLVLAGILKTEFQQILAAFEISGLKLLSSKTEREWRSGSFRLV
jgi:ribosomal protein L11 methyltransferase